MSIFEPVIEALNDADVRYVVVGGLAVVLHGYPRLTADLDLAIDLEPGEAEKAMRALTAVGLVPMAPVDPADFANPAVRAVWIRDKHMKVFGMRDPNDSMLLVDVFVDNPIDFDDLWSRATVIQLDRSPVRIASVRDLIHMKREAGRPKDLADIEALEGMADDD